MLRRTRTRTPDAGLAIIHRPAQTQTVTISTEELARITEAALTAVTAADVLTERLDRAEAALRQQLHGHGPLRHLGRPLCAHHLCVANGVREQFPCTHRIVAADGLGVDPHTGEALQ